MKKRGISPIIASILLIVFILVISVLVMNWMRKSVEKQIESGEERSEETVTGLKTGIKILGARVVGNEVELLVSNTGKTKIDELDVKIKGSKGVEVIRIATGDLSGGIGSLGSANVKKSFDLDEVGSVEKIEVSAVVDDKIIGLARSSENIGVSDVRTLTVSGSGDCYKTTGCASCSNAYSCSDNGWVYYKVNFPVSKTYEMEVNLRHDYGCNSDRLGYRFVIDNGFDTIHTAGKGDDSWEVVSFDIGNLDAGQHEIKFTMVNDCCCTPADLNAHVSWFKFS